MILFDLDGTLLNSFGVISSTTANVIKLCQLKGYYIGIITARSRSQKNIRLLEKLAVDFMAFYNGAKIYAKKNLLVSNVLSYNLTILMLQKLNIDFPNIIMDVHLEPWNYSSLYDDICHMESGDRKKCSLNKLPECDIQRIRLEANNLTSIPLQHYMTSESTFYYTKNGDAIIVHKNANKGYATRKASDFFKISLSQMIAFGDDANDIDMIKIVGRGVAMGNSISDLKKIANYVTETNENNGVVTWINKYLL